jgi:hypothetical protein
MALWLHVHGGYPSYGMTGEGWGQADYDAYKLVQLLKGHEINGYVTLQKANGAWAKMTNANPGEALDLFGMWGAKKLQELGLAQALLVPVPASDCVAFDTDTKGAALAEAIVRHLPGCRHQSALHWKEPLQKASQGGLRDADALLAKLMIWTAMPKAPPVVLVDDVATTGGHLLACARALRHFGYEVEHAVCAAQTVNTHPEKMFDIPPRDLEADLFAGLF